MLHWRCSFCYLPCRKIKTNYFIVSLAFADLLVSVLVMPFGAIELVQDNWIYGEMFCLVRTSLDVLLTTASILHLCCISLDRYEQSSRENCVCFKFLQCCCLSAVAKGWAWACRVPCSNKSLLVALFGRSCPNPHRCRKTLKGMRFLLIEQASFSASSWHSFVCIIDQTCYRFSFKVKKRHP